MRGLDFKDWGDLSQWKDWCAEQRRIAQEWPAYDPRMSGAVEEYGRQIGPWSTRLVLEIWKKPYMWHASAAVIEQIGFAPVTLDKGMFAGTKVEVPQDALLAVRSWEPEHFEQARYILAELCGPLLRPGDKHQQAKETRGLFTLQWQFKYEGEKTWLKKMH